MMADCSALLCGLKGGHQCELGGGHLGARVLWDLEPARAAASTTSLAPNSGKSKQ